MKLDIKRFDAGERWFSSFFRFTVKLCKLSAARKYKVEKKEKMRFANESELLPIAIDRALHSSRTTSTSVIGDDFVLHIASSYTRHTELPYINAWPNRQYMHIDRINITVALVLSLPSFTSKPVTTSTFCFAGGGGRTNFEYWEKIYSPALTIPALFLTIFN